jgi:hypothetical protein
MEMRLAGGREMRSRKVLPLLVLLLVLLLACDLPGEALPTPELVQPTTPVQSTGPFPTPAHPLPATSLCPEEQAAFVTELELHPAPVLSEPPARAPFVDPVFHSCVVRVTDRGADLSPGDDSAGLKNEYARVQAFNADESLVLVYGIEGTWYLYDAHSLQPLGEVPVGSEPRWDDSDPNRLYYTDENRLLAYDIQTGETAIVHDFAPYFQGQDVVAVWTRYEGRPSFGSRYWGFMAEDGDWLPVAFLVYDLHTDQVTLRDMRGVPGIEDDVDHVAMSPLGTYFLASFDRACEQGELGSEGRPCGLMVYDRDLAEGRSLLRVIGHYDTALDADGREVVIYQDIDADSIAMLDLASGQVTALWPIDFSHTGIGLHFSGCSFLRPGWGLVSTHDDDAGSYTWMDDQVFAVELKAGGRVVRLAHTHSLVDDEEEMDYWAEPHATVNRDFTRILFGTNWGRSGTGEVEMYLIVLPPDWLDRLP